MALKMPKAWVTPPFGTKMEVDASTYDKASQPGTLVCFDKRCDATLRHVPLKRMVDRDIRAYFGRIASAHHSRNCRFNVAATVTRIVAWSERFEEARNPIVIGPDGVAVLRLGIVFDAFATIDRAPAAKGAEATAREGIDIVVGPRTLAPYLRRARAVLALIARLGDADEIKDALRISYGDALIPWRDFLYGPGELGRLYGRLQALRREGRPFHPVAVVTHPLKVRTATARDTVVQCEFEEVTVVSGGAVRVAPRLSCRPPALAGTIASDRPYLVCGLPRPRRGDLDRRPGRGATENVDVYLDVVSRNQYAVWQH